MPGDCGIPGRSRMTTDSRATTTTANSPSTGRSALVSGAEAWCALLGASRPTPEREPAVLGEPSAAIHGEIMGREARWTCVDYLDWCCRKLHAAGKEALFLIWDNAPWHVSHQVRDWIRDHNRQVKQDGDGVRIIACYLPIKSPWLNAIEATWVHGKRRVIEADRLLTIQRAR